MKWQVGVFWFGLTAVISTVFLLIVLRFTNPDMTSIRFMMTYWPMEIWLAIGFGIMMVGLEAKS